MAKKRVTKKNQRVAKNMQDLSKQLEQAGVDPSLAQKSKAQTRPKIARDTLSRYSGSDWQEFEKYVLLTNFPNYVDRFAEMSGTEVISGSVLRCAHDHKNKISIIDYKVGAPMAALVMDVLSYTEPQVALMLGLCGGLHRTHKLGEFLLPMAAIRDEGASRHYMPDRVPSLPAFLIQQYVGEELKSRKEPMRTGVMHTTDYRMWEFDEEFKNRLKEEKSTAIDMECSALFTVGFARKVPVGALMLISDLPTKPGGIKTKSSARKILSEYTTKHLDFGIGALQRMQDASKREKINFRRYHF